MNFSQPSPGFGYYRGAPLVAGGAFGGGGSGPQVAGQNVFAQGQGGQQQTGAWSPTILYLFALIILEMIIFGIIARRI